MFSLLLPFHTGVRSILNSLELIREQGAAFAIGEVLICHNGPPLPPEDESLLRDAVAGGAARLLHTDTKGLGAGYRLGIREATQPVVVLSAGDFPFGFTDVESYRAIEGPKPDVAIGSKAHPRSRLPGHSAVRRTASAIFFLVRRIALGPSTPRDSQGTIILGRDLARDLAAQIESDDYGFSIELVTRAIGRGLSVREVPVILRPSDRRSSVSLFRDGMRLIRLVMRLRRSLRESRSDSQRA